VTVVRKWTALVHFRITVTFTKVRYCSITESAPLLDEDEDE